MREIRIELEKENRLYEIGHEGDHNICTLLFSSEQEDYDNYYLRLKINGYSYEDIPLTDKKFIISSSYTQESGTFLAQVIKKDLDDTEIEFSNTFNLNLKPSIRKTDKVKEVVPVNFQTAYDRMVEITRKINEAFENGDFNGSDGESAYEIAVKNGFEGTEQEWLESLDYEHSEEFTKLSGQVKEDAQKSSQAVESTTQNKEDIENKVEQFNIDYTNKLNSFNENVVTKTNEFNDVVRQSSETFTKNVENANTAFDEKVEQVNSDFDNKVSLVNSNFDEKANQVNYSFDNKVAQANSDFDTKVQSANTTIDEKVTEATNQAKKAKDEADRATLATDGKLDKNQGTDNVGKVMVVGEDGELTPTEYKSGSDNKLIGTVAKQLNPNITDSFQRAMWNLKLYGQSTQATTTGKNVFNINNPSENNNVVIENDSLNLSKSLSYVRYNLTGLDGSYIFNIQRKNYRAVFIKKNDVQLNANGSSGAYYYKFDCISTDTIFIEISCGQNPSGETRIAYDVMIEKTTGDEPTPYEPYSGGQPSPSPQYPQEITSISEFEGNVTGGNIFNPNSTDTVEGAYKSFVVNPNAQQITISITDNDTSIDITGCYLGSAKNGVGVEDGLYWLVSNGNIGNRKYTTNQKYLTYYPNAEETLQKLMQRFNIKVEYGATATPYTPYEAQPFTYTPTNPMYSTQDGSIADYVDVEKGVEVYNMIKQILTTENVWTQYTADDGTRPFGKCYTTTLEFPFVNYEVMCDYLPYIQFAWKNATKPSISLSNYGGKVWVLCVVEYETLEEFTQWLSSNPMTIFFQAQTPTEIPIPQEQLAMLRALYTYTGVTNFLCNAPVSLTYERSLQIVINNLENAIGQTNANILLNGGNN